MITPTNVPPTPTLLSPLTNTPLSPLTNTPLSFSGIGSAWPSQSPAPNTPASPAFGKGKWIEGFVCVDFVHVLVEVALSCLF
jgi:hypothetical protein